LTLTHSLSVNYIECRGNYITDYVQQNSSSPINSKSASQELCHSVQNPKINYLVHPSSSPDLSEAN